MGYTIEGASLSIETLTAKIDKNARDIYYRDIIGNITTSNVRRQSDGVTVDLTMRFPMMGGWKTELLGVCEIGRNKRIDIIYLRIVY